MFAHALRRVALRRHLILTTALCGAALAPTGAAAQAMGDFGTVTSTAGAGTTVNVNAEHLDVSASGNGIVNWSSFNIREGHTATYRHADGSSAPKISILNRVTGGTASNISGTLNSDSNVNVYILNQNGVVFGATARVNVGGLVAGTLDLTDADFLDGNGSENFSGSVGATSGITVSSGATFNVPGNLVFLGAYVNTQAPITAGGDMAFVAANDIVMQSSAGNPLKFVINRGTAVPNAIRVQGDLKGQNVTLAMATRSSVNNALLSVNGSIEATGTRATDYGVQLVAGSLGPSPIGSVANTSETQGRVSVTQTGGSLRSASAVGVFSGGDINIGDVTTTYAAGRSSYISIRTGLGDVNVGNISSGSELSLTGDSVRANNLSSDTYYIDVRSRDEGLIAISGNVSTNQLFLEGGSIYLGYDDDAELYTLSGGVTITAKTGAIYGGKGLTIQRTSLLNRDLTLTAATDILFDASSAIQMQRTGNVSSAVLKLVTGSAASRITLGNVTAQGIIGLTGRTNHVSFGNLDLLDSFSASTTQGSILGGTIKTNGLVSLSANGSIQLNGVNALATVSMLAGGNIVLNGDVTSNVNIGLTGNTVSVRNLTSDTDAITVRSLVGSTVVGNLKAANGDVIIDSAGDLTIGNLTAKKATLAGTGITAVNGSADIGGDYSITGGEVRLGDGGSAVTHKAGGLISLTSTYSRLVGGAGLKLWSLGAMMLNAKTEIAFAPDSTIQAGLGNAWRQLTLSTGAATDRITLGDVTANGITGLTGRQANITLGDVAVVQPLMISTSAGDIVAGDVLVDTSASISNSAGNITLGNVRTVNSTLTISGARNLSVGNVEGSNNVLLDARSVTAGNVTSLSGTAEVRAWDGSASLGRVTGRNIVISGGGVGNLAIAGITSNGSVTINTTGAVQITRDVNVTGNIDWTGQSIAIGTGQPMLVKAGGNIGIRATNGLFEIAAGAAISTTGAVKLTSDQGNLTATGDITASNVILESGANFFLNGNITADALNFARALGGLDMPTVRQNSGVLKVGRLSGTNLYSAYLTGANEIDSIGAFSVAELVSIASTRNLTIDGSIIAGSSTLIRTTGNLTIAQAGRFFGSNQDLALSANKLFNLAGSTVLPSGARWKVYLQSPEGNSFGGLDSGNTAIWGKSLDDDLSGVAGNRYVFAWRPTLTFMSLDAAKTYGDDAATLLAGRYTVSGLHRGIAGAFLGDTLAGAFSGAPVLSSLGSAANADVAGGPYVIDIGRGDMTSDAGYAFSFASSGRLSVGRKAITGTVTANNKTYDGTTAGSGQIGFTGALAGDDLGGSATFTFGDKNAGAGKSVSVTDFTLTGADAGNYTVTLPASVLADILRKAVSITVAIDTRTYDGTTDATGRTTTSGVVAGDDFSVTGGSYAFTDKNAGTGKTVSVSGITASGADVGNYEVAVPVSALGDILRRAVTVEIAADSKTYDGSTATTGRVTGIAGMLAGDDLSASGGDYAFADKNAGTAKRVGVSNIVLSGADAGNYEVTVPRSAFADILRKAITATVTADNKTYDGTRTGTGRIGFVGAVADDDLSGSATYSFADKNAGAAKTVEVTSFALSGADAGNYTVTVPTSALADILRKAVTVTVSVDNKIYDGKTAATGHASAQGVVQGDEVEFTSGSYAFADKNAGIGKTVRISGLTASGADAGNYEFALPASVIADILRKAVTVTIAADDKTYDGTAGATGRITGITGVVDGDDVSGSGGSYAFADKNAGQGKSVSVSGMTFGGADAGNYEFSLPTAVTANIQRKALSVTIGADGKVYDGTTAATGRVTNISGTIAGDQLEVGGGTYAFADGNAGQNKSVAATGLTLSGADAGNYSIGPVATALADIARRAITVRANDVTIDAFDRDAVLDFGVTQGSLAPGDRFTGALSRAPGTLPGEYAISQGTLALSANYELSYIPGTVTVRLGSLPSFMLPTSLYQVIELGGRATVLGIEGDPIHWSPMNACKTPSSGENCLLVPSK